METLTENVINLFAKIKNPEDRFIESRNLIENVNINVDGIERLHQRLLKLEDKMTLSFQELGGAIDSLGQLGLYLESHL
jgi:hypothetical protein